ncbi:MAG: response regulator [Pseudomonadota bacterium]
MALDGMDILLAEDNPTNQMVAVQMLESLGATVSLAVDGAEALEMLQANSYDVALIDIEMPRISGIDLIRRLRTMEPPLSEMPLIALTAYVMREHRAAIDDAGADGIIAKPILSIEQFGDDILGYVRSRTSAGVEMGATAPASDDLGEPAIDHDIFDGLFASFDGPAKLELVSRIGSDISDARTRIEAAIPTTNTAEISAATHVLISVAGAIGATKLQNLAQCLNSAGHVSDGAVINRDGPELIAEAERVMGFVRGAL